MKKLLLLASIAALFSVNSFAAFIQCQPTPSQSAIPFGADTFTCNPGAGSDLGAGDDNVNGDGFTVTSIRLRFVVASSTSGNTPGATLGITAVMTSNTGGFLNAGSISPTCIVDGSGFCDFIGGGRISTGNSTVVNVDFVPSFDIVLTSSANGTAPADVTYSAFYEVTTTQTPGNPIPEPSTMALLGSALVGLGVIARRRK